MVKRKIPHAVGMAALACFVWSPGAFAHSSMDPDKAGDLKQLVEQSNLVVVGEVANVKYVIARVEGEGELPHTIVTYKLRDSLRGTPNGETLSLRFIGGSDGKGGFMTVSGVPQFQKGEQDILFVAGNGEDERCPLVNCEWGRYRLHQNRVFNTHGRPVRGIVKNNAIARGRRAKPFETFKYPAPSFDDLMKNPQAQATLNQQNMSVEDARRQYQTMAPKQIVVTYSGPAPTRLQDRGAADPQAEGRRSGERPDIMIGAGPITAAAFIAKLKQLHNQARRQPVAVRSANPDARIVIRRTPQSTPGTPQRAPEPRQVSPEDLEEVRELKNQGFNPVLRRR